MVFEYAKRLFFKNLLLTLGLFLLAACTSSKNEYNFSRPDDRATELKGKVITLKRLKPEYFKAYFEMCSNPIVRKPLYFPENFSQEWVNQFLQKQLTREASGGILLYMIFDNNDKKLVGSVTIREKNETDPGQFACWLNDNYWGGGRIQEAIKLISDEYFRLKKDIDSFNAHVEMWNLRSYYGLTKAGFKLARTYFPPNQPPRYILEFYRTKKTDDNYTEKKETPAKTLASNDPNYIGEEMNGENKKVLFILMPENYRDVEFTGPYHALKNYKRDVAGLTDKIEEAKGADGHKFKPEKLLKNLTEQDLLSYEALIIPGGPGSVKHLWNNDLVLTTIMQFHENKKIIAAICYACAALANAGILENKQATISPSSEALKVFRENKVTFVDKGCVVLKEDKIVTAQGPKQVEEFSQAIIDLLKHK